MIEARNIHKTYVNGRNSTTVLRGVNLTVEDGAFIAIAGPSGAGKSTLLHILGGLDAPSEGRVIFEHRDLYKAKDQLLSSIRNRKFGFVFQFYHLLPEFTVLENVMMPARILPQRRSHSRPAREYATGLLEQVGLAARLHHFPSQLSGGERQRVALVRGLMNEPRILFCDEPTGNLDSQSGEEIIALMKRINRDMGMSVVLVTHNRDLIKDIPRVYRLKDGLIEE